MVMKIWSFPWGIQSMTGKTVMSTKINIHDGKCNNEVMYKALWKHWRVVINVPLQERYGAVFLDKLIFELSAVIVLVRVGEVKPW